MARLDLKFYQRSTERVARDLLGKKLVRIYRGQRLAGIITETEAYLGVSDRACHSYGDRPSRRTQAMYLAGGHAYIYLIYGMHHCFNVVTERAGVPEAVLIRALEPVEGIDWMKKFRKRSSLHELTTGPGKLAQALHLDKQHNARPLDADEIFIEPGRSVPVEDIVEKTRIGVAYAGADAERLLRFYCRNNTFVSKK